MLCHILQFRQRDVANNMPLPILTILLAPQWSMARDSATSLESCSSVYDHLAMGAALAVAGAAAALGLLRPLGEDEF
jgi:hypothetical protein